MSKGNPHYATRTRMTFKIRGHTFHPLNLAMFAASVVWLAFQFLVPLEARPPILNEAFLLVLGAWVTSKSIEQNRVEEKRERRVLDTQEKVAILEQHLDVSGAAESDRVTAEEDRVTAETGRRASEKLRVAAEEGGVTAEEGRVDAEEGRVEAGEAESGRSSARVVAEEGRVIAESGRVTAEESRVERDQGR